MKIFKTCFKKNFISFTNALFETSTVKKNKSCEQPLLDIFGSTWRLFPFLIHLKTCFPAKLTFKKTPEGVFLDSSNCKALRPCLNPLSDGTDKRRTRLQHDHHFGNNPHLVPEFSSLFPGMLPERFRSLSVLVGSTEIHLG